MNKTLLVALVFLIAYTCAINEDNLSPVSSKLAIPRWLRSLPQFVPLLDTCTGKTLFLWSPGRENYVSCFDTSKGAPLWTIHPISSTSLARPNAERPEVEPWFAPQQAEMNILLRGTSFLPRGATPLDRGHLCPNDDFRSVESKTATFVVINRAPQNAYINRGTWKCVETGLRTITTRMKYSAVVVTRLVYDSSPTKYTTSERGSTLKTQIPTHFSKIYYTLGSDNKLTSAFCVSQQNLKWNVNKSMENQEKGVYPDSFEWKLCPANLKRNLPVPISADVKPLNELRKILFKAEGKYECNASLSNVNSLEHEIEDDESDFE